MKLFFLIIFIRGNDIYLEKENFLELNEILENFS
jgi:hypothetical protein